MLIEKSDLVVVARNILVVMDRLGIDTLKELEGHQLEPHNVDDFTDDVVFLGYLHPHRIDYVIPRCEEEETDGIRLMKIEIFAEGERKKFHVVTRARKILLGYRPLSPDGFGNYFQIIKIPYESMLDVKRELMRINETYKIRSRRQWMIE